MIGGSLLFFYAGGSNWLKGMQKARIKAESAVKSNGRMNGGSSTPGVEYPPSLDQIVPPPKS
jgi:hypothetical protein